jgi:nucleotide-binding universal stress UspA family protein
MKRENVARGKAVVVGVDGSPESVRAAALAWRIAEAGGAPCVPVCALPDPAPATALGPPLYSPDLYERLYTETRRSVMDALRRELPGAVAEALEVQVGRPATVLTQVAAKLGAGLVVVGGRPHGALARGLGGSTAHTLVRILDVPVLVAGPGAPAVTRVLAAVDLSDATRPTAAAAAEYARLLRAPLRLLFVVEPVRFPVGVPLTIDRSEYERRATRAFDDVLRGFASPDTADRVVRPGTAVEGIATEAAEWGAGLIVVGSHGKTWVDRMLIGSTTERLLNLLPASLLVVPIKAGRARGRRRPPAARPRRPRTRKGSRV